MVRLRRGLPKPLRVTLTVASLLRWGRRADLLFVNGLYGEAALAYYHANRDEIDADIAAEEAEADRLEREHGLSR